VRQAWCFAAFSWQAKPAVGPALRMSRRFALDVAPGFDRLLVSAALPERSVLSVTAEHAVDLRGARRHEHVAVEVRGPQPGSRSRRTARCA
jgi:hypothetical protein